MPRIGPTRIQRLEAKELSVPLLDPFVIATARVDVTPNVLIEVEILDETSGKRAVGLGEAATLHPVTKETQASILGAFASVDTRDLDESVKKLGSADCRSCPPGSTWRCSTRT